MTNPTQPAEGMPELPEGGGCGCTSWLGKLYEYTAEDMREYGRQCAAQNAPLMPPDARRALVFFRREFPVTSKPLLDWLAAQGFTKE